jgi:hypothetical protein
MREGPASAGSGLLDGEGSSYLWRGKNAWGGRKEMYYLAKMTQKTNGADQWRTTLFNFCRKCRCI